MANEKLITHWLESSNRDFETMEVLFKNKHYHWSLFVGHLVLEKLLKSLHAKLHNGEPPVPWTHNLTRLAELCSLEIDADTIAKFNLINSFNQEARYQDSKNDFYRLCTKEFTEEQISIIKEKRLWLKEQIEK